MSRSRWKGYRRRGDLVEVLDLTAPSNLADEDDPDQLTYSPVKASGAVETTPPEDAGGGPMIPGRAVEPDYRPRVSEREVDLS